MVLMPAVYGLMFGSVKMTFQVVGLRQDVLATLSSSTKGPRVVNL